MHAILVDPVARTVTALEYNGDSRTIAKHIGADFFDSGRLGVFNGVMACAYVDDNGLLKPNACFRFKGYHNPLAGKALILGLDRNGETRPCPLSIEQVADRVEWIEQADALAGIRTSQAIDAAEYRARGYTVETHEDGLVNVITGGGAK